VKCPHPECTGVHDNNRYRELCPRSRELKHAKDMRYEAGAHRSLHKSHLALIRRAGVWEAELWPGEASSYWDDAYRRAQERHREYREKHPAGTRRKPSICMYPFKDDLYPVAAIRNPWTRRVFP
jgi:hypothetical protein